MNIKNLIIAAMLAACLGCHAQITKTRVSQGEIEGIAQDGYALYKKIPYAEAPVGNLRWKAPVPKAPWQGVYKSDEWAGRPWQPYDPAQGSGDMTEDCLYLSVQTPAKSTADRLPVFVMIHGGAFISGSYIGTQDNFMDEGIVYVSVEYRLGAFGFMSHPQLTQESDNHISGNYGILDQIEALKWIHDNIEAFGGDPGRVTIAGESAGGISVSILCASPLCKGLFQNAICESGSSFWPVGDTRGGNTAMVNLAGAEKAGLDFQKGLGCKHIKDMRKLSPEKIVAATQMEGFWPIVDGYAITDDQYKLYQDGTYNDVNVLMGTNSDEGSMFTRPMAVDAYRQRVRDIYGDRAEDVLDLYPAASDTEAYFALSDIFRDGSFAWGTYAWANLQSATGKSNIYMYYFDHNSQNTIFPSPRGGATHVAEMPFFYGYKFGNGMMTDIDTHMQQIMHRYVVNFTKTGNPNAEALPYWPTYRQGSPTVMIMRNGYAVDMLPNQAQMDFFEDFFKSRRK